MENMFKKYKNRMYTYLLKSYMKTFIRNAVCNFKTVSLLMLLVKIIDKKEIKNCHVYRQR